MPPDIKQLRTLIAAAERGSFSSAALQLNVEISAVSRTVRDVEEALGVLIFERLARGVRLTPAGEVYVAASREIVARLADAAHRAKAFGESGAEQLSVGFVLPVTTLNIASLLGRFTKDEPRVTLNVVEDGQRTILARVRSGELDAGLVVKELAPDMLSRRHDDIERQSLWREMLMVAVPARAAVRSVTWRDLAEHSLLCRPQVDWRQMVAHVERFGGPALHFVEHEVSGEGLIALVGAGLGWALLPGSIVGAEALSVRLIGIESEGASVQVEAVWLRRTQKPALRRFIQLAGRLDCDPAVDGLSRNHDLLP